VGERWYVCESSKGTLTELDVSGTVRRRVGIKRFARGLTVLGRWALVGGNAQRGRDDDRGEVVVVDLRTMDVVDRIALPCLEVYDIVPVEADLARGLALGFGGNVARSVDQHRADRRDPSTRAAPESAAVRLTTPRVAASLAAMGRELSTHEARRCGVRGPLVDRITAGIVGTARVVVSNGMERRLGSVPPRIVSVGARWWRLAGPEAGPATYRAAGWGGGDSVDGDLANPRVPLPRVVVPGGRLEMSVPMEAPDAPGTYVVRLGLFQRGTGWFGAPIETLVEVVDPTDPDPRVEPTDPDPRVDRTPDPRVDRTPDGRVDRDTP
jgi:hypothetical protein